MPCASTREFHGSRRPFKPVDRGNGLFRVGSVEPRENELQLEGLYIMNGLQKVQYL